MKVKLIIEGEIKSPIERITGEIEVPDNYNPSFEEFCKVRGCIRYIEEKFAQTFCPPANLN